MKKTLLILFSIIALWSSSLTATASRDDTITVPLSQDTEPEYLDRDPMRKRLPSRPLVCTISQADGVTINGASMDIILYEIWDAPGSLCLGSYVSEAEFIDSLFSLEGEYQIRFITDDYSLSGYIFL